MGSCLSSENKTEHRFRNTRDINRQPSASIENEHRFRNTRDINRQPSASNRPRFGEYKCLCGRIWNSRSSWQYSYQICKRCKKSVYPHSLRELRPTDMTFDKENRKEHQQELCQMCKELGQYCGNVGKGRKNVRGGQTGKRNYK